MGKRDWAPWLLEGLSQDRPVISLDNRGNRIFSLDSRVNWIFILGIGESSVTKGPYTIELMMEDCIEVIESLYG